MNVDRMLVRWSWSHFFAEPWFGVFLIGPRCFLRDHFVKTMPKTIFLVTCCAAAVLVSVQSSDVEYWMTTETTNDRLTQQASLSLSSGLASTSLTTVNINLESQYQTILGFGGALTQSSATVFKQLPSDLQDSLLDSYYGDDGIGYSTGEKHVLLLPPLSFPISKRGL